MFNNLLVRFGLDKETRLLKSKLNHMNKILSLLNRNLRILTVADMKELIALTETLIASSKEQ